MMVPNGSIRWLCLPLIGRLHKSKWILAYTIQGLGRMCKSRPEAQIECRRHVFSLGLTPETRNLNTDLVAAEGLRWVFVWELTC